MRNRYPLDSRISLDFLNNSCVVPFGWGPYQGNSRVRLTFTLSVLDMLLLIVFNCYSLLFSVIYCYLLLLIVIDCYWLLLIVIDCYWLLLIAILFSIFVPCLPKPPLKLLCRVVRVPGGLGKSSLEFATKNRRTWEDFGGRNTLQPLQPLHVESNLDQGKWQKWQVTDIVTATHCILHVGTKALYVVQRSGPMPTGGLTSTSTSSPLPPRSILQISR